MSQTFILLALSILTTVAAQLLFKKGILMTGKLEFSLSNLFNLIIQIFQNLYLLSGLFVFGVAFLLWLFVLSKMQLNIVYPVTVGLNLCLITIISWFLFKEYLSFYQILGIGSIMLGVFLLLKPGGL